MLKHFISILITSILLSACGKDDNANEVSAEKATNNSDSNNEIVYTGNGTFDTVFTKTTGTAPLVLSNADFNEDEYADIVVANMNSNNISIFFNDKNGGFDDKQDIALSASPWGITTGDLDNDSNQDIIVGVRASGIDIFYGNGDGTFETKVTIDNGYGKGVSLADLNEDNRLDIVVVDSTDIKVLLATGTRTFATAASVTTTGSPTDLSIKDFNADGDLDIAHNDYNGTQFGLLFGNGDGTFGTVTTYTTATGGEYNEYIESADMDGDGDLDIFVPSPNTANSVSIFQNNGSGVFTKLSDETVGSYPGDLKAFDYNSDDKLDLIVANYTTGDISVLLGNGDGSFQSKVDYTSGGGAWGVTIGDFDKDTKMDIAVTNYDDNTLGILNGL